MFLTIEIRGAVNTVRTRNGEEVSDPVLEFEEGVEPAAPVVMRRIDLHRINKDGYVPGPEGNVERQGQPVVDLRVVGSAGGSSAGDLSDDETEDPHPRERAEPRLEAENGLVHMALERPRRFLRRLHAESARRGRVTVRFLRPLDVGTAAVDFTAEAGTLVVKARIDVARALGGALSARAHHTKGLAGFEIDVEAKLRSNGDLDEVQADARTRGLELDHRESRMMARLARVIRRVADTPAQGRGHKRKRLARILRTWLREHPIWAVALLDRLFEDLDGLPLAPSVRHLRQERKRDRGGPTLEEILAGVIEPGTGELTLGAPPPPSLEWIDDRRYRILTEDSERSSRAELELGRLACVVPVLLEGLT